MDINIILTIISSALALFGAVASGFLVKAKGKLAQLVTVGREFVDVANEVEKILLDNTITKEEVAALKVQLVEAKSAFKALITKQ